MHIRERAERGGDVGVKNMEMMVENGDRNDVVKVQQKEEKCHILTEWHRYTNTDGTTVKDSVK